ncbi:MAG TPA: guanylate kinase [Deltaproteobacteria bacterium]|nr:guanylate kinase [Deltaproteobacteria bacterium]
MGRNQETKEATGNRGHLLILSAPSGAGKTTIRNALCRRFPGTKYSVSYTTRSPRTGEKAGRDYHFIDKSQFEAGIEADRWAEWAVVHGNYYGTSGEFIDHWLARGEDILLDIDVQGTVKILKRYPQAVTIFILPPSMDVLRQRLESRGTDSQADIERRLSEAKREMMEKSRYRHLVINDDLSSAIDELASIIKSYEKGNQ